MTIDPYFMYFTRPLNHGHFDGSTGVLSAVKWFNSWGGGGGGGDNESCHLQHF